MKGQQMYYAIQTTTEKKFNGSIEYFNTDHATKAMAEDIVATLTFKSISSSTSKDSTGWNLIFHMENGDTTTARIEPWSA